MSEKKEKAKKNKNWGKELFGRIMAGILAIMMLAAVVIPLIFTIIG